MRPRLSPTWTWRWESMPGQRQPLADEGRVGVDHLAQEQLGAHGQDRAGERAGGRPRRRRPPQRARTTCRPSWRYWTPVTSVIATASHTDEVDEGEVGVGLDRGDGQAHGDGLDPGLDLARHPGRHRDPPPPDVGPVGAHRHLPGGDQRHRHPPHGALGHQRRHRPQHQHLVGQRVEERARAGRPLAAGQPPVGQVAHGQHEPQRQRLPLGVGAHDQQDDHRQGHHPDHGDGVGRRGQRGRPEGGRRHAPTRP